MNLIRKAAGTLMAASLILIASTGRITPVSLERQAPDTIQVEIKGEVVRPDVYTIKNGATIKELIAAAGGETENADLSDLSLQEKLHAKDVIVIRRFVDEAKPVSISTATKEELMELPGVGESTAEKIIAYREEHGFTRLEDLMEVPGIGPKKFEKLRDRIAL